MHAIKGFIVALSALAAGLSGYLTVTELWGLTPAGCGGEAPACEGLLNSRWSAWLGMPVAAAATGLYGSLAVVAALRMAQLPPRVSAACRWLTVGLLAIAAAAALWFIALQLFVLHRTCWYCMAIHTCGLVAGTLAAGEMQCSLREAALAAIAGVMGGAVLIAGQLASPNEMPERHRYRLIDHPNWQRSAPLVLSGRGIAPQQAAAGNLSAISFADGQLSIAAHARPEIGRSNAPHRAALLFDYTCGHCRRLHEELRELVAQHPQEYGIVLIHLPLQRRCNPHVRSKGEGHGGACQLAELALAVWLEDPAAFTKFDGWLCTGQNTRPLAEAQAEAVRLVGATALKSRLGENMVPAMLAENVALYAGDTVPLLPTLITSDQLISGSFAEAKLLRQFLGGENLP